MSLNFEEECVRTWDFQLKENAIMREMKENLNYDKPFFFPIEFFKKFRFVSGDDWEAEIIFRSSGTTGVIPSAHHVRHLSIYKESTVEGFRNFFPSKKYAVFALLPGYIERPDASLVYMVNTWIDNFGLPGSGFFLDQFDALNVAMKNAINEGKPIILIGVAFAIVDFAEKYKIDLPADSIVIETGGMKGRKREPVREELHDILKNAFGLPAIQSEYGMTELLSQAYALKNGKFHCSPWMKVTIADLHHPFIHLPAGEPGRICITDLKNIHSCAFIRTDDLGRMNEDGSFEVLGRIDNSELRGCSLMYG